MNLILKQNSKNLENFEDTDYSSLLENEKFILDQFAKDVS